MAIVSSADAGLRAAPRATILQLRSPQMPVSDLEREAERLVASSPIPVLISSRCDLALAVGAAGVNLPERDVSPKEARSILGVRLIGRSVHSLEGAAAAERAGADFVIFGPVWESATHQRVAPTGIEALKRVASSVGLPVLAIGGVTEDRVPACLAAGAAGYAAIRMFQ